MQSLLVEEHPWAFISMDFIKRLKKGEGKASIIVMVVRFSKYVIFIDAPTFCFSKIVAELLFKLEVRSFGVPLDIFSDRDTRIKCQFWTALFNIMGTKLKFSTLNHPQINE